MGRQVRRVPLDFDWPLNTVWKGFLSPDRLNGIPCPDCTHGHSAHAEYLRALWYGRVPFDPALTGSTPLRHDTPAVRARAERNIANAPEYYGTGETAVQREGHRLANLWNRCWCHHLEQHDVDVLIDADRLWDFTHTWSRHNGWQKIHPPVHPTAQQVNDWSLRSLGHDGINASIVIRARCARYGASDTCTTCQGDASLEAYPGQRADAEAWEPTDPPPGDGWQLWETVSEGSPISPVLATAEELARWMTTPAYDFGIAKSNRPTYGQALAFINAGGWAPTMMSTPETGLVDGVTAVAVEVHGA